VTVRADTGAETTRDLGALKGPVEVPLPQQPEATLELVIGYCASDVKEVCYIERARIPLVRSDVPVETGALELAFRPGAHRD
jgi:hypothetical protein